MNHVIVIAIGGAIGASARHYVGLVAMRNFGTGFPYGTLTVNIVGSFVMGLFIAWLARHEPVATGVRLFFATGVLGGFTTFSAFSLEVALLWERGAAGLATLYVAASVVAGITALFAGLWVVRSLS